MSTFNKYRTKGAYHWSWYETEDWYKYLIDRAVKFCKGSTIDLGGGDGVVAKKISEKGHTVLVADNDEEAKKLCFGNGIPFVEINIDAEYLAQPFVKFDYLACINAIEHFNNPEKVKDLIKNNINKGAIITTIDYQGGSLGEDHKFEWTYDQMMDFFKEFKPKGFRYKDTEWIGVEITK